MHHYVAISPGDGLRVVCPWTDGPKEIRFGSDDPMPLPGHGIYLVAATFDGQCHALMQSQEEQACYLVSRDGTITRRPGACGQDCVAITPTGHVGTCQCASWTLDGVAGLSINTPTGGTSQGFMKLEDDGTPLWVDTHRDISVGGYTFNRYRESAHWIVGFDALHGGKRTIAYEKATGKVNLVTDKYTTPVGVVMSELFDGSCVVGLNLTTPETAGGLFIPSAAFTPLAAAPWPEPDLAYPACNKKLWVSTYYEVTLQYATTPKARVVGNALLLVPDTGGPFPVLIEKALPYGMPLMLACVKDGAALPIPEAAWNPCVALYVHASSIAAAGAQMATARAVFASREKPFHVYLDLAAVHDYPVVPPEWLRDDVVVTAQAYRQADESIAAYLVRMRAINARLAGWGRTFGNCYRFDTTVHTVEEIVTVNTPAYVALIRECPLLQNVELFSGCREGAGIVAMHSSPALREAAMQMYLAVPERPSRYDGWRPPTMPPDDVIRAKLRQDIALYDLTAAERARLLALLPH